MKSKQWGNPGEFNRPGFWTAWQIERAKRKAEEIMKWLCAGDTPDLRRSETVSQCLRTRILEMMKHREWSTHWIHRSAYLHLESAELAEAVRGKRGDTLDESADVLITMLALSPHNLPEIVQAATAKVESLMTKPRYAGETGTFGDVRVNAGTEETVHAND